MNQHYTVVILISIELLFIFFFVSQIMKYRNKSTSIFLEPIIFFLLGSATIYIVVPGIMLLFDWKWHNIEYSNASYLKANLMVFGYIMVVVIMYYLMHYFSLKNNVELKHHRYKNIYFKPLSKKQLVTLIIIFFIPIFFDTLFLVKYMFQFGMSEYLNNRIILRKGMGLYVLISFMSTLLIPILFAHLLLKLKNKNKIFKIFALSFFLIIAVLPFISAFVLLGNRLPAFIMSILLIIVYLIVMEKKVSLKLISKYLFGFIILFLFFTFAGFLRLIRGDISKIDVDFVLSIYSLELKKAFVFNFGNFEHLVWLIEHSNNWDILYGKTFFAGLVNIIPRSLLENKLLGGGPTLKNIIHPGSYDLSAKNITSFTTGIAIETFMNFKYFGLLIIPFFHSIILLILKSISNHIKGNILLLIVYLYLIFAFSFLIMFGEFLGIYTMCLIVTLPFILFYLITKRSLKRGRVI